VWPRGLLLTNTPDRFRAAVALSVLTGLRQSEMLGLRRQDIDGEGGLLRVRFQLDRHGQLVEPKTTASIREVPIPLTCMPTSSRARSMRNAPGSGWKLPSATFFAEQQRTPHMTRRPVT
jgi:integrase